MSWSNEAHVERLKELWKDGLTASQVAAALAREFRDAAYSRNAVLGKIHRLGVAGRAKPSQPQRLTPRPPSKPRVVASAKKPLPSENSLPKSAGQLIPKAETWRVAPEPSLTIIHRVAAPFGSPGCRWPVSGEGADMMCCGANRVEPTQERPSPSYCAEHAAIAYQKPKAGAPKNAREMFRALRRYAA